jgi:hypothetical protein
LEGAHCKLQHLFEVWKHHYLYKLNNSSTLQHWTSYKYVCYWPLSSKIPNYTLFVHKCVVWSSKFKVFKVKSSNFILLWPFFSLLSISLFLQCLVGSLNVLQSFVAIVKTMYLCETRNNVNSPLVPHHQSHTFCPWLMATIGETNLVA